ncbi:MAG: hypothetical protein MUP98_16300, partial [Candidatus Aminicenantes bacterium]|nr:hypothetical protein [Candidatus Aminicenantes bacterium]
MKRLKQKQFRILFLFILGVGIPSLLLGYLAFRGIRNDQALLEREKREELQSLAETITIEIENTVSQTEQSFIELIVELLTSETSALNQKLNTFKDKNPLVKEPFFLEAKRGIQFPAAKLLYLLDGSTEPPTSPLLSSDLSKNYYAGQQAEFQKKDFRTALSFYQQAFRLASDSRTKGELLNAVARVQKKSSLFQEAIDTYKVVVNDYGQERLLTGIPLGTAAHLEIGSLYLLLENPLSSGQTFVELYRVLLQGFWKLERAQYDYFVHSLRGSLDDIFSQSQVSTDLESLKKSFQQLVDEEKKQKERTEEMLVFKEKAASDLLSRGEQDSGWTQNSTKRFTLEIERQSFLTILLKETADNKTQNRRHWGLLIDQNSIADEIRRNILENLSSSKTIGWIVRDREGLSILSSENLLAGSINAQANFKGNFPDWQLHLFQQDPRLFETFLTSKRGIYFFMFLLIGGILIFGSILTVRTVSRELELARMKSDFVSTISHEFKSPLTSIRQLAEMLQSGRVPSDERRQKYYDVLVEQSERLTLLTDNVLSFAKMEEGKKNFVFESLDVGALLENIVSAFQDRVSHENFK